MNDSYDFCILITTYDRGNMLYDLINQIEKQKNNSKILIVIFDDGSPQNYQFDNQNIKYVKFFPNQGKKKFWRIIDTSFRYLKKVNSKYFIYMQDDISLEDNFFDILKDTYENIKDEKKIALSFLTDDRTTKPNWTSFNPVVYDDVIKTQWIELHFICEKPFLETLDYKIETIPSNRWDKNPNLSSGVGWQISNRLFSKGLNMYHTKKTLVHHGIHESKMNKEERINNKLVI
jgi:glycosyltransferase involved in cell wall biosynthesis